MIDTLVNVGISLAVLGAILVIVGTATVLTCILIHFLRS